MEHTHCATPLLILVSRSLALARDLPSSLAAIETYKELRQPDEEEIDAVNQLLKAMQEPRRPEN